jgi:hypothetical protein
MVAVGANAKKTFDFPKLKLIFGRGFDHEIVRAEPDGNPFPVARVHVDIQDNEDVGLEFGQLFEQAPDLLEVCELFIAAWLNPVAAPKDVDRAVEFAKLVVARVRRTKWMYVGRP